MCIFCEDIRAEVGNKFSLMGIFAADIAFPVPAPVILPKFGFVLWMLFDVGDEPERFTIRVLVPPDRTETAKIEGEGQKITFPYPPDELSHQGSIRIVVPMINVSLEKEGFIEVMIKMDDEDEIRAGRLLIRFGVRPEDFGLTPTASNAPAPPS
jgi:hypothetical protein